MANIREILRINLESTAIFSISVEKLFEYANRINKNRENRLKKIRDTVGENQFQFKDENLIPIAFSKFKYAFKNDLSLFDKFRKKELRAIAYSLSYSQPDIPSIYSVQEELKYFLLALKLSWRPSYLFGLLECYLKNWGSSNIDSNHKLGEFIIERLNDYDGERKTINSLKAQQKYYDHKKGDVELGKSLAIKKHHIGDAINYLNLPEGWFSCPYFSMVILAFYDQNKYELHEHLDDLVDALTKHNNSITNQRLIAKLIIQASRTNDVLLQDRVKSIAFTFIGDPEKASTKWSPKAELTDTEKSEIIEAKKILNNWIKLRFITVFFEICINDPERKQFWIKIAPKISSFKVIGSLNTRESLLRDKRVTEFVNENRFSTTQFGNTSALLMLVNDYILIEFSDPGYAFYAYKQNNKYAPSFEKKYGSVNDLRDGNMPRLVYQDGRENAQGRMPHSGFSYQSWQTIFLRWLNRYVRI